MKKQNLKQLIKSLSFSYVSPDITEDDFPDDGRRGEVEIIDFERDISSEEALKEMDEKGYRPANAYELLTWAKDNWNRKDCVVELDSKRRGPDGHLCVLFLWGGADFRGLHLHWFDDGWRRFYRFAFVRNVSSELGTLKTKELSTLELRLSSLEKDMDKIKSVIKI